MALISFDEYKGDRSVTALAKDFEMSQPCLRKAILKGRNLFVEVDRKNRKKRLIEIKVIREVAA
jgi:hypothetical protein